MKKYSDILVLFLTAKLAKELGFFYRTKFYYNTSNPLGDKQSILICQERGWSRDGEIGELYTEIHKESGLLEYQINTNNNAPSQAVLESWIRDEHEISIHVDDYYTNSRVRFDYSVGGLGSQDDNPTGVFDTYEMAKEAGLMHALITIKEKKIKNK
jgi:hypothetical protein